MSKIQLMLYHLCHTTYIVSKFSSQVWSQKNNSKRKKILSVVHQMLLKLLLVTTVSIVNHNPYITLLILTFTPNILGVVGGGGGGGGFSFICAPLLSLISLLSTICFPVSGSLSLPCIDFKKTCCLLRLLGSIGSIGKSGIASSDLRRREVGVWPIDSVVPWCFQSYLYLRESLFF